MQPVPQEQDELALAYAYPNSGPWLRANMVASIDGAATLDGRSGGLGGPADHRIFHLLRGLADVVIAGAQTVRAEGYGPVRPGPGWAELRKGRPAVPRLAIVSRSLDLDLDAPVFTEAEVPTIVLTCTEAAEERRRAVAERAEVIVAGTTSVDFVIAAGELAARGLEKMLCEGGPRVLAQMVAAGVLDELCLTLSPVLVAGGGKRPLNGVALAQPQRMKLSGALTDEDFLFLRYTRQ